MTSDLNQRVGVANEASQVLSMPLPPMQYIKQYSEEALQRGICPLPPPRPNYDQYMMFGQSYSSDDAIIQSLESQGIRRLFSSKDIDRKKELKKLNHSIFVNFLDLLDILVISPDSTCRDEKIDDLNLLFVHMHHLINEFRPLQARETLSVTLHLQKRRRHQTAEKFQTILTKVQESIQSALSALPDRENEETMEQCSQPNDTVMKSSSLIDDDNSTTQRYFQWLGEDAFKQPYK